MRGSGAVRLVTFEAGDLTVEVEITEAGPGRRMVGQLVPPQPARVQVRGQSGAADVDADELGRFTAEGLAAGRASLRCHLVDPARVVETGWVVL